MNKYNPADVRVLVVEDHNMIKKTIIDILRNHGFEDIQAVTKGRDAITALKRKRTDFVLLDLYLPEVSGLEVLEFIRQQKTRFDIPVLIISGEASKDDIIRTVELGSSDYLVKPFQTTDLEKKVESVLNSYFSPGEVLRLIREAETLLHKGKLADADYTILRAINLEEDNVRANYLHGIITDAKGDTERAIQLLMNNRQRSPKYLKNYAALADMFIKQLNFPLAIKALQNELMINPKDASRQMLLANLLKDEGEFSLAIEHYRKALVENSTLKAALMGMGDCLSGLENPEKALYYYRRLRKNYPHLTVALEKIIDLSVRFKQKSVAENYLKTELKSHPRRCDLYLALSKLYCRFDDRSSAEEVLTEAQQKFPDHSGVLEMSGYIHMQFGEVEKALAVYEKVFRLEKLPRTALELAKLYHRTKRYDHALRYLQWYAGESGDYSAEIISRMFYLSAYNRQLAKAAILAKRYQKEQELDGEMKKLEQAVIKNLEKRRREGKKPRLAS